MTTSDLPPHELRGPLGQVGDAGGISPLVRPLPNAAQGSPGLATAALAPPIGPTLPSDDPNSMGLLIAKLAGEMFGGASVIPVPMVPANLITQAGLAAPGSPGIAPSLAPASPMQPSGGSTVPAGPSGAAPSSGPIPSAPSGAMPASAPSGAIPPTGAMPSNAPSTNPFATTSFEVPSFADPFGVVADVMRLPMTDGANIDAAPYFLPDRPRELESPPPIEWGGDVLGHEVQPVQSDLVRDLGRGGFDPYAVRRDFPILEERVHGKRIVWLDNAATTQKPQAVIDRLSHFYAHENSNVHRAAHTLAARATDAYEGGRETTRKFLNASSSGEIIFVRGATEGINLVAQSWGRRNVAAGDEIVITWLEHHANIVPWQMLCAEKGAKLRVAPVDDRGDIILEEYEKLLGPRTRLVALPQVSNALGTITPAREMVEMAHRHGARVLVDGAQAVSHMRVDVQQLDCDFYVFSGHKVFAPTGIGVVFGKREVLEAMPPWQGGGNMIQDVRFEKTTYQGPPWRFEAGTGNIADAAGLGAALDYVMRIGMDTIDRYEHELLGYATERLAGVPGLHMIGTPVNKAGVLSFVLDGQRTEDVGAALDQDGIAVRSGHHCAQPILRRFGVESSVRASLAFYNVCEDIDALVEALLRLQSHRRDVR
ncbi:MAG: putative cysteine desulfurase [Myxococcales bacterium]|nr:putative cysteine desulfurase [Myxococcales bacterium]